MASAEPAEQGARGLSRVLRLHPEKEGRREAEGCGVWRDTPLNILPLPDDPLLKEVEVHTSLLILQLPVIPLLKDAEALLSTSFSRVRRRRPFWLESESMLESVKFGRLRLLPGVAD